MYSQGHEHQITQQEFMGRGTHRKENPEIQLVTLTNAGCGCMKNNIGEI